MFWLRPRRQLFFGALLDLAGVLVLAFATMDTPQQPQQFSLFLLFVAGVYLLLGWLFGSYTLLPLPWVQPALVAQRLATTTVGTWLTVLMWHWLTLWPQPIQLLERGPLLLFLLLLTFWSLTVRLLLRRFSAPERRPAWELLVEPAHHGQVLREWRRNHSVVPPPRLRDPDWLPSNPSVRWLRRLEGLAMDPGLDLSIEQRRSVASLESFGVPLISVAGLAERQLERLPPALLPDEWLDYAQIPWSNAFSIQRKLKRVADVALALALLLVSAPLLLILALLILVEDGGPILYVQERSGWMGRPFQVMKLRTMHVESHASPAVWTQPGDDRITWVGRLLRRTRLDELPQLINVLRGEMSLIGPRPERPELEEELEARIPHYRKRHWMLPGLSGWAQVCAPYAASLEEAELKLSYDLYYLRHFSVWLDLLILAKTVKTVLKARGR